MRRSSAPSLQSSAKRFRFLSPFIDSSSEIKENDLLDDVDPEIAQDFKQLSSYEPVQTYDVPLVPEKDPESSNLRSTTEIMQLILGATEDSEEKDKKSTAPAPGLENRKSLSYLKYQEPAISIDEDLQKTNCSSVTSENSVTKYNVLWCKRSGKKHKIWEGDGTLIIKIKNRSAILKNSEGKEIDRGMGYKFKDVSALEEGSKFCVGGKECEIQSLISSEICAEEKQSETLSLPHASQPSLFKNSKRFKSCM